MNTIGNINDISKYITNNYSGGDDTDMTDKNMEPVEYSNIQHNKKNKTALYVGIILVVIILVIIIWYFLLRKDSFESFDQVDPLTKCGWIVYVRSGCPWCTRQREILTSEFPSFKGFVENGPVQGVPTWYNTKTNQSVSGMQVADRLRQMAKC
jgi:hypothetical protein